MKSSKKLSTVSNKVIVKTSTGPTEETTSSGLVVVQSENSKYVMAEVVAVGPEQKAVKIGDHIVHQKAGPIPFAIGNDYYTVVDNDWIFAVVG